MSQIEDLERKVQSLRDQLSAASKSLRKAKLDACPVKIGDIVRYKGVNSKKNGQLYKVTGIDTDWGLERPWLTGSPKGKDGSWGRANRNLYTEWEPVRGIDA